MSEWVIKKGNTVTQDIPIYDEDGDLVTTLAAATEAKFQVKDEEASATVLLEKTLGAGIAVDTPVVGYVRLTLTATNTDSLDPKYYYMALQIVWGAEVKEVYIMIEDLVTEKLKIIQDIVL